MQKSFMLILFMFYFGINFSQTLNIKDKIYIKKELKRMVKQDQVYRKKIVSHPPNESELWAKQTINDSINKIRFIYLIDKYGYPSIQRVGVEYSVLLILHFTNENDFYELQDIFKEQLTKGNVSPLEYARWYDRCQINMGNNNIYGVYGKKEFCGDELKLVNKKRQEIGLDLLKQGINCE